MITENTMTKGEPGQWERTQYEPYEIQQEEVDKVFAEFEAVKTKLKELNVPFVFMFQFCMLRDGAVGLLGEAELSNVGRSSGEMLLAAGVLAHEQDPVSLVLSVGQMVNARNGNQIVTN